MVLQILCGLSVLAVVTFAFDGLGALCLHCLRLDVGPGLTTSTGFAIFTAMTGPVELMRLGKPHLFTSFLLVGLSASCSAGRPRKVLSFVRNIFKDALVHPWHKLFLFLAMLPIACYLLNSFFYPFNAHDDFDAYLVFAKKILQVGYTGEDPFNVRSIEQGFGAASYLNAMFMTFLPFQALHLAEAGVGSILLVLLAIEHVDQWEPTGLRHSTALLAASATVIGAPIVNVSPALTGCGITYAIMLLAVKCARLTPQSTFVAALLAGALILLKGVFLLPAAATLVAYFTSRAFRPDLKRVFCYLVFVVTIILALLSPWMFVTWRYAHTPFYPILGGGILRTGSSALASVAMAKDALHNFLPFYLLMLFGWLVSLRSIQTDSSTRLIGFVAICCVGMTAAAAATPAGGVRYCYALLVPPIAFIFNSTVASARYQLNKIVSSARNRPGKNVALIIVLFVIPLHLVDRCCEVVASNGGGVRVFRAAILARYNDAILADSDLAAQKIMVSNQDRLSKLQSAVPPDAKIIARVDIPFLLDFRRNNISVMDWPGSSGPAPGVPSAGSPEALADYLLQCGFQYVAYSYKNEALHPRSDPEYANRLTDPSAWIRNIASNTFAIQDRLLEIGRKYQIVYDNGQDFIVDISKGVDGGVKNVNSK